MDEVEDMELDIEYESDNDDEPGAGVGDFPSDEEEPEKERKPYQILSVENVTALMEDAIRQVRDKCDYPEHVVRILLNHVKWDIERVFDLVFEGRVASLVPHLPSNHSKNGYRKGNEMCLICFDKFVQNQLEAMICGHQFCLDCWKQYLKTKISRESALFGIRCAQHKCEVMLSDDKIRTLLANETLYDQYRRLVVDSYVLTNRYMRWCPGRDCNQIVKVETIDFMQVECTCGSIFCFLCGDKWHEPARCDILKSWMKRCAGETSEKIDSETANWIMSNTKDCPKCKAAIEKNGGCNHMTCRNANCRFEFCWVCMSDWKGHGGCNRFDEKEQDRAEARKRLERYIHFWSRYQNHHKSAQNEQKLFQQVHTVMEFLQKTYSMSWIEVQFLKTSFKALHLCRQTLMYSYAFAFYLEKNNDTEIFLDNQNDLEMQTDKLSELLEKDLEEWEPKDKDKALNTSKYCESRRKILIDHVQEGYDKEFWHFQPLD